MADETKIRWHSVLLPCQDVVVSTRLSLGVLFFSHIFKSQYEKVFIDFGH